MSKVNIEEEIKQSKEMDLSDIVDEGKVRSPGGRLATIIFIIGILWSFFHLYTAGTGLMTAMLQRSAHLSVGLALCFLYFPLNKKDDSAYEKVPWYDLLLAIGGFLSIFYVYFYFDDLVWRIGAPTTTDLIMGGLAIVLILLAAHRAFGLVLPIVTIFFLTYPFLGQYYPVLIGHGGYRLTRVINDLYITNTGIFGIPIGVSATFVFIFVLFGSFFQTSGAGLYIVRLAFSTMGRFRGGPAKAAVVASGFMGSIIGSSVANTVVTGSITIPVMKKAGFTPEVAGGVETAASTDAQFLPPIMGAAAFVMAEFTGIPYWQIAIAAALPAVISYFALLAIVHLQAAKTGMKPMAREDIPPFVRTFIRGIFYWFPICILVYYLLVVRLTPILAGYYAILAVLLIIIIVRCVKLFETIKTNEKNVELSSLILEQVKGLWGDFLAGLDSAAKGMAGIAVACACAGIIVGVVTITGLGQSMILLLTAVAGDNLLILLLMAAGISIILGTGLPTTAKYVVMATLVAPAVITIAPQVPVLAIHLFILYYAILADDTPPVGVAAYAAAAVARSEPIRTGLLGFKFDLGAFLLPFMFVYNPEFLLIDTTWYNALFVAATSLFGIYCFSAVIQQWLFTRMKIWEQVILLGVALSMIWPTWYTDIIGATLFLAIYFHQKAVKAREDKAAALSN